MKRIFAILFSLAFAFNVYAADIKISELPVVTSVTPATDVVPVVASGATSQVTVTNLMKGANAGTATALAADPADCAAGQVATGIAASGALTCTATPSVTTLTGAVTGTASGNIPNTLADAKGDLAVASADNTWGRLAVGATNTLLYVNSDTPAWLALGAANTVLTSNGSALTWASSHSHSDSAAQFYDASATTSLVKIDPTAGGAGYTATMTFPNTADATYTFPTATSTLATLGANTFTAGQTITGDILPEAANTRAIGSATAEWADLYLGDGAKINMGNDQEVVLEHVADKGVIIPALFDESVEAATDNLSALQLARGVINNYGQSGDAVLTLPAAAEGLSFIAIIGDQDDHYWRFNGNGAEKIYCDVDGTPVAKDYIQSTNQIVGSRMSCVTFQTGAGTYQWLCSKVSGTWVCGDDA